MELVNFGQEINIKVDELFISVLVFGIEVFIVCCFIGRDMDIF